MDIVGAALRENQWRPRALHHARHKIHNALKIMRSKPFIPIKCVVHKPPPKNDELFTD